MISEISRINSQLFCTLWLTNEKQENSMLLLEVSLRLRFLCKVAKEVVFMSVDSSGC